MAIMFFPMGINMLFGLCTLLVQISLALAAPHTILSLSRTLLDRSTKTATYPGTLELYTPPASYTGDVLNITRCYCADPSTLDPVQAWGHYTRVDHFNKHNGHLYSMSLTCNSSDLDFLAAAPRCWSKHNSNMDHFIEKKSVRYDDGNVFAYTNGFETGLGDDHQLEHYQFNNQKRGLPKPGPGDYLVPWAACDGLCREHLPGMAVARDEFSPDGRIVKTWFNPPAKSLRFESALTVYTNTDDMCPHCK